MNYRIALDGGALDAELVKLFGATSEVFTAGLGLQSGNHGELTGTLMAFAGGTDATGSSGSGSSSATSGGTRSGHGIVILCTDALPCPYGIIPHDPRMPLVYLATGAVLGALVTAFVIAVFTRYKQGATGRGGGSI